MPIYEYECSCGNKFEALRKIEDRHNAICSCGRNPKLKMSSWGRILIAGEFKVIDSNGRVLENRPTTNRLPYQGISYREKNTNASS